MKRFNLFLLVFAAIGLVSCEKDSDVISGNYYAEFKLCEDNDMVACSQATNLNELAKLMNAELANTKFDESQLNVYLEKAYGIVENKVNEYVKTQTSVKDFQGVIVATNGTNTLDGGIKIYVSDGQVRKTGNESCNLIGGALAQPGVTRGKYLTELKGCWVNWPKGRESAKKLLRDKGNIKDYNIVDVDMAGSAGTANILIGGEFSDDDSNAITAIIAYVKPGSSSDAPKSIFYDGVTFIPVMECDNPKEVLDLNKRVPDSSFIGLYYTTDKKWPAITNLKCVSRKPLQTVYPDANYAVGLKESNFEEYLDLNNTAGGTTNTIYLGFDRKGDVPY